MTNPTDKQIRAALLRWTEATERFGRFPMSEFGQCPGSPAVLAARELAESSTALLALGNRVLSGKKKGAR